MEDRIIKILLKLANKAYKLDESPIAALIVKNNKIISKTYNRRNKEKVTISHAEITAIIKANKKLKTWRLNNCTLYVTVQPCEMCEKIIKEARIDNVFYLVERNIEKKQYNRTNFEKLNVKEDRELLIEEYKRNLNRFWKNKRKNKVDML